MNWIQLDSEEALEDVKKQSMEGRILIFRYSPSSSISILLRGLFEREWAEHEMEMKPFFLDVSRDPSLSKKVDKEFGVKNDVPQLLVIEKGKCIYSGAYGEVDYRTIRQFSNLRKLN